jgi:hypothetical protein
MLILTCLKSKVKMYEKMGFVDRGIANSTWGGEEWHEMSYRMEYYPYSELPERDKKLRRISLEKKESVCYTK